MEIIGTFWCGFCGSNFEAPITRGIHCDMMGDLVDADAESRRRLDARLAAVGRRLLDYNEDLRGAVVITPGDAVLSAELIDMAVMFHSHVVLTETDGGIRMFEDMSPRLRHRIETYIDGGLLTVVAQPDGVYGGPSLEQVAAVGGVSLRDLSESVLGNEIEATRLIRSASELVAADAVWASPMRADLLELAASEWRDFGSLGPKAIEAVCASSAYHLLTAFARRYFLTRMVSATILGAPEHAGYHRALLWTCGSRPSPRSKGVLSSLDWYSRAVHKAPLTDDPRVIVEWRQESSRWDFVNLVLEELTSSPTATDGEAVADRIEEVLSRQVERAKMLSSRSGRYLGLGLGGAVATAGGLVGGVPGAVIAGLGAVTAEGLVKEALGHGVGAWTSYFVSDFD